MNIFGRIMTNTMLLLPCLFISIPATAQECATRVQPISCDSREGIFYQFDRDRVRPLRSGEKLSVPNYGRLAVSVCGFNNMETRSYFLRDSSLIPNFIDSVGRRASLRIDVIDSANIRVSNMLVVGEILPEGRPTNLAEDSDDQQTEPGYEPALIDDLIQGFIGERAEIQIHVVDSANVTLTGPNSQLHIGGGSLIEELVNQPEGEESAIIRNGCIEAHVSHSANVEGPAGGFVYVRDGQLENESVDYALSDTRVIVTKEDVANVHAAEVHIFEGELTDEAIDTGSLLNNSISVDFRDLGNVESNYLRILSGELVDEVVDALDMMNSTIEMVLENVATTRASTIYIRSGELLDEAIDAAGDVVESNITVSMMNVGNAWAQRSLGIAHGELVDEVLDTFNISKSNIEITLSQVANSYTNQTRLISAEQLDETIDAVDVTHSNLHISLSDTGNAWSERNTRITRGELVDEALDNANILHSNVNIRMNRVANFGSEELPGGSLSITQGQLLDEALDTEGSILSSTGSVIVVDSANAYTRVMRLNWSRLAESYIDARVNQRIDLETFNSGKWHRN